MAISPQTLALLFVVVIAAGFFLYRAALPKPIPVSDSAILTLQEDNLIDFGQGIPFDPKSGRRLLGDVPDALTYHAQTSEMMSFMAKRCRELNTPVCQVFMRPFSKPWVVVSDGREAQDIMTRRGRDFDRSNIFRDMMGAVIPHQQSVMPTNNQWRYNRRLVADAMSSEFLNKVAAYRVHEKTIDLIDLWRQKIRLSPSHAYDVYKDVQYCTVDTIWAATFETSLDISKSQTDYLSTLESIPLPASKDIAAIVPEGKHPEAWITSSTIVKSFEIPMNSPLGRHHHWFAVKFYPKLRKAMASRNKLVTQRIKQAWNEFGSGEANEAGSKIRCAVDLVIEREAALAKKEGKEPDRDSPYLFDEMAGFLQAGYETTSSTLNWGVKYLTKYQDVQKKLRDRLRVLHKDAYERGEQPAPEEIAKTRDVYLEAFIDEVMRHCGILSTNARIATCDTDVLGYRVPKGSDVFLLTNGPSFNSPAFKIDDNKRSATSREYKGDTERWNDHNDLHLFRPERWLHQDEKGETVFDNRSAPMQTFGAGIRSCFGKRLAYLEMRVIYTLIVWNLELKPIPESLDDMKATDILTHTPQNVRVLLSAAK